MMQVKLKFVSFPQISKSWALTGESELTSSTGLPASGRELWDPACPRTAPFTSLLSSQLLVRQVALVGLLLQGLLVLRCLSGQKVQTVLSLRPLQL